jgi:hypothetical protein
MPAVATEIDFTEGDVLKFMLQTGKFRNPDKTLAQDRIQAARDYLATDWEYLDYCRWKSPGFDPQRPFIGDEWKTDPTIGSDLKEYIALKEKIDQQLATIQSGPDKEYKRAYNSLLMMQRVDLWGAGAKEVEAAVQHLLKLGQRFNHREPDYPEFITEFYPGVEDF